MPLTFPSHAAAAVPLKMWRPRWFDGVALVVGSAVPDLPFAFDPWFTVRTHTWWGLVWFCVPMTLLGTAILRSAAPTVAAHLPGWGREYGVLGRVRHRWWVTVASAYLGALSHRLWDMVTHESIDQGRVRFAWLSLAGPGGVPVHTYAHLGSTVLGALGVAWCAVLIGRRGLLVRWHGPVAPGPARAVLFWGTTGAVTGLLAVVSVLLPGWPSFAVIGVRWIASVALGVLAGVLAVRTARLNDPVPARAAR
ncbi:DUF4184 family protein [Longispora sp. K20-0274]|uniref:DUF4184 family protein n=1 Tax=Longispora sp. K20-0274 TaxID=3088255 RepID=UPI00399979B7